MSNSSTSIVSALKDTTRNFKTVAKMEQSRLEVGRLIKTHGYHNKGDGGHCVYLVISEAEFAYGDKSKFDGVFHHLANGNMAKPLTTDNRLTDSQCGVIKDDDTKKTENVAAWNTGSFACKAYGWTFVSSGNIYTNNTLFIESFSDVEFRGRCTIIHDDIGVNEFGLKDILSTYPVNIYHKGSINLDGTVIIKYIRDDAGLSSGNGFNIGNLSTCNLTGFECRVFDAEEAVHGQSIVDIQGGSFQATNCYRAMKIIPNAGITSEASASTSFDFDVRALNCVHGVKVGTAYYASITGWTDGARLSSPRRKAGDMPISCFAVNNCQGLDFRGFGSERCDGMFLRVDDNSVVSAEISTVALPTDVYQSDATLINDVPFDEQGWISIGTACAVDIRNPSALLPYTPVTDTWILSIGTGSRVNITSGKLGFNGSGPKLSFVRGDITYLWINGTRNVPQGWSPGYEYHGNNKGTFTGTVNTDSGGEGLVNFGGAFNDPASIQIKAISSTKGAVISYKSLTYNSIIFESVPSVVAVNYSITAYV